jgi:hypothetical protein
LTYQIEELHPGQSPLRSSTVISQCTGCTVNYLVASELIVARGKYNSGCLVADNFVIFAVKILDLGQFLSKASCISIGLIVFFSCVTLLPRKIFLNKFRFICMGDTAFKA